MSCQLLKSEFLVDLSTQEQEVLSGGIWVCRKLVWRRVIKEGDIVVTIAPPSSDSGQTDGGYTDDSATQGR